MSAIWPKFLYSTEKPRNGSMLPPGSILYENISEPLNELEELKVVVSFNGIGLSESSNKLKYKLNRGAVLIPIFLLWDDRIQLVPLL